MVVRSAPAKVYTTEDLRSASPTRESAAASASSAPQPTREGVSANPPTENERGETYWRDRIAQAQTAYDAAQHRAEAAQDAWNDEGLKSHRGMVPEAVDEPGYVEGMLNLRNGLARPCQRILIYDPTDRALFAELAAAVRSVHAAWKELTEAQAGALRAGIKL